MTETEFVSFAKDLASKIELPDEALDVILKTAGKVFSDERMYSAVIRLDNELFAQNDNISDLIGEYLDESGNDSLSFKIFLSFFNAVTTKKKFADRGWGGDVYYASMYDITIWTKVTHKKYGVWGLENYSWVDHFLKGIIVRLGRLQFHEITYDRPDYDHAGVRVKKGDKVINIHIPEGDSLTKDKRIDAYKRAYKFFGRSGKAVFVCDSWLFYDKHREFLSPNSNILDFMNDFHYIEYYESHSLENMWRIFGFPENYDDLSKLPRTTGMQRAYADWLISHGTTGSARGVMIFDGENIL